MWNNFFHKTELNITALLKVRFFYALFFQSTHFDVKNNGNRLNDYRYIELTVLIVNYIGYFLEVLLFIQ